MGYAKTAVEKSSPKIAETFQIRLREKRMVAKAGIVDTSKWLTPKQVMTLLQYRRVASVTAMCINGTLRHLNRGSEDKPSYLIDPDSIAEWQRRRIAGGADKKQVQPATQYPPGVKKFV